MPQFIKLTRNGFTTYHNINQIQGVWVEKPHAPVYKLAIAYGVDHIFYYDYDTEAEANKALETIVQNFIEVK